jgi:hypothetical protein
MKKYKVTTAKNAAKKGYLKEGDKFWAEMEIVKTLEGDFAFRFSDSDKIRIPIPEPKPIDFGEAGRVLKGESCIVKTTGYHSKDFFSGIYIDGSTVGFTSNGFIKSCDWQDITDTYKP